MTIGTDAKQYGRRAVLMALAGVTLQTAGCGTIFWPERKGQPAGRLDPKVVTLDAIGLLLFFIPGVIAFAVDFNNGTIYLPPDEQVDANDPGDGWTAVATSLKNPTPREIERIVHEMTGKSIRLRPGHFRATELKSREELAAVNFDQMALAIACEASDVRFRAQSD